MPLSQSDADALLQMAKEFAESQPLEYPATQALRYTRTLRSVDRREEFLFDLERGQRNRARLRYQTRARRIIILARLDLDGPAHRNPPNAPHRPGERLVCPHFHLYREGFEDRVAYLPGDVPALGLRDAADGLKCLEDFLGFCAVQNTPAIQLAV